MKTNIVISSKDLTKEDIAVLLQVIRDCEQQVFPNKQVYIGVLAPNLSKNDASELLGKISPPFKHGPFLIGGGN